MLSFKEYLVNESIKFQLENNLNLCENTYRVGTDNWKLYWSLLKETKDLCELSYKE